MIWDSGASEEIIMDVTIKEKGEIMYIAEV